LEKINEKKLTQVAAFTSVLQYLKKEAKCRSTKKLFLGKSRWIGFARIESMGKELDRWI
jgi:hypothetical protein